MLEKKVDLNFKKSKKNHDFFKKVMIFASPDIHHMEQPLLIFNLIYLNII